MDDKEIKNLTGEARRIAYQKVLDKTEKITLTEFFKENKKVHSKLREILYPKILKHYTWNKATKTYSERSRRRSCNSESNSPKSDTIGRIPVVAFTRKIQESYFLRLLLHHVKGLKSYQDLKTVDGEICDTFQAACIKRCSGRASHSKRTSVRLDFRLI